MPAHFEAKLVPVGDPRLRVEWYKDGRPIQVRHISFSYRFQKGDSGLNCTISYYLTMSDDNHRHFIGAWVNFTLGVTYYVVLLNINCDLLRLRSFFMDQL